MFQSTVQVLKKCINVQVSSFFQKFKFSYVSYDGRGAHNDGRVTVHDGRGEISGWPRILPFSRFFTHQGVFLSCDEPVIFHVQSP